MLATILSGIAEFERDLLSDRVKSGLVAAKARGKRLGRPPGHRPKSDRLVYVARERARGEEARRPSGTGRFDSDESGGDRSALQPEYPPRERDRAPGKLLAGALTTSRRQLNEVPAILSRPCLSQHRLELA